MNLLSIGYSPCPNDTFIFHALSHGLLEGEHPSFAEPVLADVETLNEWAMDGMFDVTKLSFHALGHVLDKYVLLNSGSALGFGCGPLLITGSEMTKDLHEATIAIPGHFTTAALLLRSYCPQCIRLVPMRFDLIMPSIASGAVDAGVVIHESRFTYRQYGLVLVQDLGEWWEDRTSLPIPLGGIAVKRSLGESLIKRVDRAVAESVRMAIAAPERSLPYIRRHAQEMDDAVIRQHISLYVNSFSENLGLEGQSAVREFLRIGRESSVLPNFSGKDVLEFS